MLINADQLLLLFYYRFREYGMELCKVHGIVPFDLKHTMNYKIFTSYEMNDTHLSCECNVVVNAIEQTIELTFSPKNKFDIHNLVLPCNQDPQVIQKTYNLLHTELSKETFNVSYKLTYSELHQLYAEHVDGNK